MGNYYYQSTKSLFKLSIKQGLAWMFVLTLFGFIRYYHTDADADYYIGADIINNFTVPVVLLIGFFNGVVLTYLEAHFLNTYAHRGSLGYIIFLGIFTELLKIALDISYERQSFSYESYLTKM